MGQRIGLWIGVVFTAVASGAPPQDGVERLRIDGTGVRKGNGAAAGPRVRLHQEIERLFIDDNKDAPRPPAVVVAPLPQLVAPTLPKDFGVAAEVQKSVDEFLVYTARRMARDDNEGKSLRTRRRELIDVMALQSKDDLARLDGLFTTRAERKFWGELKGSIPAAYRSEPARLEEHARMLFARSVSFLGAQIRDNRPTALLPPELVLSLTLKAGSGTKGSFAREQFVSNAIFSLEDSSLSPAVRQIILTKYAFDGPWTDIVADLKKKQDAALAAANPPPKPKPEIRPAVPPPPAVVEQQRPNVKEDGLPPLPKDEVAVVNIAPPGGRHGVSLAPVDRRLIRPDAAARKIANGAERRGVDVVEAPLPEEASVFEAYVANVGEKRVGVEEIAYRARLPMRIPPPYRAARTWRIPHENRIGKDGRNGELPSLLRAFADYADLFDQTFANGEAFETAFKTLQDRVRSSGFRFPKPTLGIDSKPNLPGDYDPQILRTIFNLARDYRYQTSSDRDLKEPEPSKLRFEGWVGRQGAEFGYFSGINAEGIRQVIYFDPHYVELPVDLDPDGGVRPHLAQVGESFQIYSEVEPDLWKMEIEPSKTYFPPYFRWNDEAVPSRWEMGLAFLEPAPSKASYLPLSAKFSETHYHGGSWDRLSSLLSPFEPELEAMVNRRKLVEQVYDQYLTYLGNDRPAEKANGERVVTAEGLRQLWRDLIAVGGSKEPRPKIPVWRGGVGELFKGAKWHFGGMIMADQGPSSAFALAPKGFAHVAGVRQVAFYPNGRGVLTLDDRTLNRWETNTGRNFRLHQHENAFNVPVTGLAVGQQTPVAVTIGSDGGGKVWDLTSGDLSWEFELGTNAVVKRTVFADNDRALLIEIDGGRQFRVSMADHQANEMPVDFPESRIALPAGETGAVQFNEPDKENTVRKWKASDVAIHDFGYLGVKNGDHFFVSRDDRNVVRLWRLDAEGKVFVEENGSATCVAVSPDKNFLLYGYPDGTLWVRRAPQAGEINQPLTAR